LESTIIGLIDQKVVVYRYGSITPEALSAVLGYLPEAKTNADGTVLTSGMVKHHYATQTPLFLGAKPAREQDLALQISLQQDPNIGGPQLALSTNGSMIEAARNLYATLHQADALGLQKIYVAPFTNEGLGRAMNDRLMRAAAKFSQV
jgi:L-threonylcarbamoyladenylate synthase